MHRIVVAFAAVVFIVTLGPLGFALGSGARIDVSQKGRAFTPASVEISRGDTLAVHNDDEYVHQVFVDSPDFKFDSKEQDVGQTVEIQFPTTGTYQVLCAIHPRMRLDVVVK